MEVDHARENHTAITELKNEMWDIRPKHARKLAAHTIRWFRACDAKFVKAFRASGEAWPSNIELRREAATVRVTRPSRSTEVVGMPLGAQA